MKLAEIVKRISGRLTGGGDEDIQGIASLEDARAGDISFLRQVKYASAVEGCQASAILAPEDFSGISSARLVYVADVDKALEELLEIFGQEWVSPAAGVHERAYAAKNAVLEKGVSVGACAVVGDEAYIGANSVIGEGCVVGRKVRIGADCRLFGSVVIYPGCVLGDRVVIHANSTIGADGFGYRLVDGAHRKIPHIGTVIIEDDVEIGANSCVDRAKFGRTVVGRGTKIDNLVQVGHNVRVGEHCILVAQTGIGGSAELGSYVVLGGQVGITDHVKVGAGVQAGGGTGILRDLEAGAKVMGMPARPVRDYYREFSYIRKLSSMAKEIKALRKQIENFAGTKNDSERGFAGR